jgi:hypothetical protein
MRRPDTYCQRLWEERCLESMGYAFGELSAFTTKPCPGSCINRNLREMLVGKTRLLETKLYNLGTFGRARLRAVSANPGDARLLAARVVL